MPWHGKKNSRRAVTLAPSPGQRHTAEDGAFARGLTYLRDRWLRRRAAERRQHHNAAYEEELPPSCLVRIRNWLSKKAQQVADSRILCCLQHRKQWSTKVHPFQEPSQDPGSSVDKRPTPTEGNVAGPSKVEVKPTVGTGTGTIIHESPSHDVVILNDDLDIVSVASDEADVDTNDKDEIPPEDVVVPEKIPTYPFGPSNSPGTSVDGPEFSGNVAEASVCAPVTNRNVDGISVDPPVIGGSAIGTSVDADGTPHSIVVSTGRYEDGPSTSSNMGASSRGDNAAEQQPLFISTTASATVDAPSTPAEVEVNEPRGQAAALVYRHEEAMQLQAEEQALIMEICERRELEWQSGVQQHVERTQLGIEQERHLEEMRGRQSVLRAELARSESVLAERRLEAESPPASRYADITPIVVPRPGEGVPSPTKDVERGLAEEPDCDSTLAERRLEAESPPASRYADITPIVVPRPGEGMPSPTKDVERGLAEEPDCDSTILSQQPLLSPRCSTPPSTASSSDMFLAIELSPESSSSFEDLEESVASCSTSSENDGEEPSADPPSITTRVSKELELSPESSSSFEELEESVASCSTSSENDEETPSADPPSITARASKEETQHALGTDMEKKSECVEDGRRKARCKRPVTAKQRSTSACVAGENSVRPRSASQLSRSKKTATKVLTTNKTNGTKCGGDRPSTSKEERKVPQCNRDTKSVTFSTPKPSDPPIAKPSMPKHIKSSRNTNNKLTRPATPMPRALATTMNGSPKPAFTKSPLASNPRSAWSTVAKAPRPGTPIPGPGNPMPPAPRPVIEKSPLTAETKSPISTTTQSPSTAILVDETATTQSPVPSDGPTGSVRSKVAARGRKPRKSPSSARARSPNVTRAKFPTPVRSKSPITGRGNSGHRGTKRRRTTAKVRPQMVGTKASLKRSSTSPTQSGDPASNDGVGGVNEDGDIHVAKKKPVKTVSFAQTPDFRYFSEKIGSTSDSDSSNTEVEYSDDFESDVEDSGDF